MAVGTPVPCTLSQLSPTTADEVRKVLTTTRLKQSPTDVLPTSLLRSSVDVFAPVTAHIANLSFSQSRFPAAFKTAQVLPLLKKPSLGKEQIPSYQPISNLTTVSKITERLVLNRLRPRLLASPCFARLARLQSEYRCGHSTETALLHVTSCRLRFSMFADTARVTNVRIIIICIINSVYAAADNKEATILVGLDISAAFDTINHDVLISRLVNQFGVDGGASGWLRSYLTDRSQYVKLGENSLATARCVSDVPQESVLRRYIDTVLLLF